MKLTKIQANKIANNYCLGIVKSFKLLSGGLSNYNFNFVTTEGEFIVRILGQNVDEKKENKLKLEFNFLNYLHNNKFPYHIPFPIKNNKGKYLSKVNESVFWVYEKLPGINYKKFNNIKYVELAKVVATLHKYSKKFKFTKSKVVKESDFRWWLLKNYKEMRKLNPTTKLNKLILKNIDFFEKSFNSLENINFKVNEHVIHGDLTNGNVLFHKGKIISIIDFDGIEINSRVKDLVASINRCNFPENHYSKLKKDNFLREYNKINKLTKKEKELIIPLLIRDNCVFFYWGNIRLEKIKNKYDLNLNLIKNTKKFMKELSNL